MACHCQLPEADTSLWYVGPQAPLSFISPQPFEDLTEGAGPHVDDLLRIGVCVPDPVVLLKKDHREVRAMLERQELGDKVAAARKPSTRKQTVS
jgi:hypothetical protein